MASSNVWQPLKDVYNGRHLYIGKQGHYLEMGGDNLTLPEDMAICRLVATPAADVAAPVPAEVREAIEDALSTWIISTETDLWNGYAKNADADLVRQRSDKVRAWLDSLTKEASS